MGGGIPDSRYVTGEVPVEMRGGEGIEEGVVAAPTGDPGGAQLLRLRIPRPENIPAYSPPQPSVASFTPPEGGAVLHYMFGLLPGVQCEIRMTGNATASHLEQLIEMLGVQARRMRSGEGRRKKSGDE